MRAKELRKLPVGIWHWMKGLCSYIARDIIIAYSTGQHGFVYLFMYVLVWEKRMTHVSTITK
jgi:hypothetical protein